MLGNIRQLWSDEDGLASVEYALLLAVLVVLALGTWQGLSSNLIGKLNTISNAVK